MFLFYSQTVKYFRLGFHIQGLVNLKPYLLKVKKGSPGKSFKASYNIQLSPEGEVNSGGYIPRCEASRYISTALHRP